VVGSNNHDSCEQVNSTRDCRQPSHCAWISDTLGSGTIDLGTGIQRRGDHVWPCRRCREAGRAPRVVSGTLIRDRVMVTAGHFTAPAKRSAHCRRRIRIFASFSPTDAKDPRTGYPWSGWRRIHRCRTVRRPAMRPDRRHLVAPLEPGIADVRAGLPGHAPPGITPARFAEHGTLDRSEGAQRPSWDTAPRRRESAMHPRTPRCGTGSGASGLRYCDESSTRLGRSGPYPATFAPATRVAAFS
jgi:hypothetical protein